MGFFIFVIIWFCFFLKLYDGITAIQVGRREVGFLEWSFNDFDGATRLNFFKEPNENTKIYLNH